MNRWVRSVGILGLMSAWAFSPAVSHAAGKKKPKTEEPAPEKEPEPVKLEDEKPPEPEPEPAATTPAEAAPTAAPESEASGDNSPVEEEHKEYKFIGFRYRGIVVPQFIQNLFADGGRTVYVHAFGPEYVIRKDNFEFGLSPWLAFYSMEATPFKGKTDPETSWEYISSNIKMLYLTADLLWSKPISPKFAVNYGFGAGLGFTFGDLHRVQSYPGPGSTLGDPGTYLKCPNAGAHPYCADPPNNHYGNYTEPSWFNGGGKWSLFPWLAIQTGFRFKPSKKFVGRFDLGFGTSGFFFGFGADYGL